MNEKQLFIPDRIKVGFQKRGDTYTRKLAYVIYFDKKGVLRKEKSWEGWRDKKIEPVEFPNEPTEGFVLNKGVGGQRQSYGWNARNEYIRVYDPRDFEFEISVANLLFVLREGDCSRGKGLEGRFVYSWDGTELVLLPVHSQDYQNSQLYTDLQGKSVKASDLIPGAAYTTRKQEELTYLGRFDYFFLVDASAAKDRKGVVKKFVFWDGKKFVFMKDTKTISALKSDTVAPDYAELVDRYYKSPRGSRVIELFTRSDPKDKEDSGSWYFEDDAGAFVECTTGYRSRHVGNKLVEEMSHICYANKYYIKDGVFIREYCHALAYSPTAEATHHYSYVSPPTMPWREPTTLRLFALTENGGRFRVTYNAFCKD